ncbi:inositol monophosphatase family protein [Vibrio salinus]|uniref:inositol monophosphatase family protein n=1 Tax=Vibrio salinus TaxID=2899784 RepID=UPI001E46E7E4|nr:inositol monophosphatase family protein [Vibrio salinus]MCE0495534.1 inositol monophosphatase [Vibrio salinus]
MNSTELKKREDALKSVLTQAGNIALRHFQTRQPGSYTLKGNQDFLTEADALVEQYIRSELLKQFPEDGLLGEETGGAVNTPQLWVVDPIDGTANFARGIAHFCVSIAFVEDGVTLLGGIYNPATDEIYLARKNAYAQKNGLPLTVADTGRLQEATFELGWSNRVTQQRYLDAYKSVLLMGANVRRGASGALALAWVAEGRTDGYAELHMNAWDCLAGLLLVEEAGGRIGTFPSSHAEIAQGGAILASAPNIAEPFASSVSISLK